jgi:predicted RNA polymerase sigma factor
MPTADERGDRLRSVLHVLYLLSNEGYASSAGADLHRVGLSGEASRLARALHALLPRDGEVAGLLALMLLTDARRPARTGRVGELAPLAEQDRSLWDRRVIAEGMRLNAAAMSRGAVGEYQLQAAVAALHGGAARAEDTDWAQILGLYGLLQRLTDNPVVGLSAAVAAAMVHGPAAAWNGSASSTGACPATTASTPRAATCTRCSTTPKPRPRTSAAPWSGRPASRNGATC